MINAHTLKAELHSPNSPVTQILPLFDSYLYWDVEGEEDCAWGSPGFYTHLGLPAESGKEKVVWDCFLDVRDVASFREHLLEQKFCESRTTLLGQQEKRISACMKGVLFQEPHTGARRALVTFSDYTDLQNSAQERTLFDTLINSAPVPIFYKDREGRYLGCNTYFEELLGLEKGEALGKTIFDIAPHDIAGQYHQKDEELFANPEKSQVHDYVVKNHQSGKLHDVISHKSVFHDSKGDVVGLIGVLLDITDIRLKSAQLSESRRKYRQLIADISQTNIIFSMLPNGILTYVSPSIQNIMGIEAESVIGEHFKEIGTWEPEMLAQALDAFSMTASGEKRHSELEMRIRDQNENLKSFHFSISAVIDEEGLVSSIEGIATDISRHKRDEEALLNNQEILREAQIVAKLGHYSYDIDNGTWESSDTLDAIFEIGDSYERSIEGWLALIHPDDREMMADYLQEHVIANRQDFDKVFRIITQDQQREKWIHSLGRLRIDSEGKPFRLFGVAQDITEQVMAEQELRKNQEKYRKLLEAAAEGFWLVDRDSRTLEVNDSLSIMLGCARPEILGKTPLEFMDEENTKQFQRQVASLSAAGNRNSEITLIRKDGSELHTIFSLSVYRDDEGEEAGIFMLVSDITERKKLERQLMLLNETLSNQVEYEVGERMKAKREKEAQQVVLVQQSKMAAMGEMIRAIAHQWRQPLNVISLLCANLDDMIMLDEITPENLEEMNGEILSQVEFMNQTITDFSNFFKPSKEKSTFRVSRMIDDMLQIVKMTLVKYNISTEVACEGEAYVEGYPSEFKQVLLNLIMNAKDVFLERHVIQPRIGFHCSMDESQVIVRVRDNGGGIPDELLPDRLFEINVTTKGDKGSGIGLQLSQVIIESHMHGKLWVHNVRDGAEFVIEMPLKKVE